MQAWLYLTRRERAGLQISAFSLEVVRFDEHATRFEDCLVFRNRSYTIGRVSVQENTQRRVPEAVQVRFAGMSIVPGKPSSRTMPRRPELRHTTGAISAALNAATPRIVDRKDPKWKASVSGQFLENETSFSRP